MKHLIPLTFLFFSLSLFSQKNVIYKDTSQDVFNNFKQLEKQINDTFPIHDRISLDSVNVDTLNKKIGIYFNRNLSFYPFRENTASGILEGAKKCTDKKFTGYKLNIFSGGHNIKILTPNYFRIHQPMDKSRLSVKKENDIPIVTNLSKNLKPENGLYKRNIALWPSHGCYYEPSLDRWEWQRARVLQTVEDIFTASFVLPYLVPMLENAGADVFLPRERDFQLNEVVVDNDSYRRKSKNYIAKSKRKNKWQQSEDSTGFKNLNVYTGIQNPFRQGTYAYINSRKIADARIKWIPEFSETGDYGVYISYKTLNNSTPDAHYTLYHAGRKTEFSINQKKGGGTWIYLGKFKFKKGYNPEIGRLELTDESNFKNTIITADAVRFGGGKGNISRNGKISRRPRFAEAARYYLQFAGTDTSVYHVGKNEYWDDILARGNWVNYLCGSYYDTTITNKGLNIPIDAAMAFHTDAGQTTTDSVIGTLLIYDTKHTADFFPDGVSRVASRDFADIMQTQIVHDIRAKYFKKWTRRGLWDKYYAEARVPAVPTILLELLSHHNFEDMKYGQNPQFRFDVSRAIYKSILRFLSVQNGFDYVVQPLPVKYFQATFKDKTSVKLKWKPTIDSFEKTANAEKYIVYIRKNDGGFDNGRIVEKPEFIHKNIETNVIYGYKVTALNKGGESFPSEILSVCKTDNNKAPILIVNAFDRISAPEYVDADKFRGFVNFEDAGVPDKYDIHFIGNQYDFRPLSEWKDDDDPGLGASYADYESKIIAGNTFDFPYIHGKSIKAVGYSFVSVSDEAFENKEFDISGYKIIDFIFGEEKEMLGTGYEHGSHFKVFNGKMKKQIETFCNNGGNVFLSGAYIGTDLKTKEDNEFVNIVLKYKYRTNHADNVGDVYSVDKLFNLNELQYNTISNSKIYSVEAPDALESADKNAKTILRYRSNNMSAAVAYKNKYAVVALGFPFETINSEKTKNNLMHLIIDFFEKK